jgi:hypothetical protein
MVAETIPFILLQARFVSSLGPMMRSANPGMRATIFGAYGFVGRYVTALLGEYERPLRRTTALLVSFSLYSRC